MSLTSLVLLTPVVLLLTVLCFALMINYNPELKSALYDRLIVWMTSDFYHRALSEMPWNSHMLDVGIGTGSALIKNAKLMKSKRIRVTGVDYDPAYVRKCQRNIDKNKLRDHISVICQDIYQFRTESDTLFDLVYFSDSLCLLPDPVSAIKRCLSMVKSQRLKDGEEVFFATQTFEEHSNVMMEILKPLLKYLTTIDFGTVTYWDKFEEIIQRSGLEVVSNKVIGSQFNNTRTYRLITAKLKQ